MTAKKKKDLNVARMRKKSGSVNDDRLLVGFLYMLMRDQIAPGRIEGILLELSNSHDYDKSEVRTFQFTNGWLAKYARDVADRLVANKKTLKVIDKPEKYDRFK
jgi:hypothetical protein